MMVPKFLAALAAATMALAAVNEPCYGSGGRAGEVPIAPLLVNGRRD